MTRGRVYPVARPVGDVSDPRFTFGLVVDVGAVLVRHGYPAVADGLDYVELQQALFRFIYGSSTVPADRSIPEFPTGPGDIPGSASLRELTTTSTPTAAPGAVLTLLGAHLDVITTRYPDLPGPFSIDVYRSHRGVECRVHLADCTPSEFLGWCEHLIDCRGERGAGPAWRMVRCIGRLGSVPVTLVTTLPEHDDVLGASWTLSELYELAYLPPPGSPEVPR